MELPNHQLKKAVIYCRVSTKEQAEEGNSLATQERLCKEYATIHGYEVAATFIEQGESAKTLHRTELKKLIAFCSSKANKIAVVIAYKLDRISRNTEDYSYIKILLRKSGVQIKSTSENFDNTPAGRFMESIISNVSQFDNDVRAERCSGGMKDAVREEGRYVWLAPFGYSNVRINGKATIAPNEDAHFVLKTFTEVAKNQYPPSEIRKKLIALGMIMKSGKPISKARFYHILRDELYAGWINKFGERHKGTFEPIISEQLFAAVQQVLTGKKCVQFLKQHPDFPLRKLFKYSDGQLLTGGWSRGRTKKYAYYSFHNTGIHIRKEVLEAVFARWLNMYFKLDVNYFDRLKQLIEAHALKTLNGLKSLSHEIPHTIELLKNKQRLILDKNIEGVISNDLAREQISFIDAEIYDLQQQLKNEPNNCINEIKLLESVKNVLLHPGDVWQKASIADKIKLQWFYFPHGINFTETESRTEKICKLFKAKLSILSSQFRVVDHSNSKLNTQSWQTLKLPSIEEIDINTPESFEEIKTELFALATITHPELNEADLHYAQAA